MKEKRVIVYIDENTDDGMMWEELNQEGQMQVSVYDEEYEYDVEYHHSIVVKSLQEYLADYTKQVRKEVVGDLKEELKKNGKCSIRVNGTMDFFIELDKLNAILDQIQGETK